MEEKKLTVTFVNVGYGEAILLESPDPSKPDGVFTALIDGGSAEDSEFADRSSGRVRIEEYLKKHQIAYRNDATNFETEYTRNRIRLDILPYVTEHINPAAVSHIAETAAIAADICRYIEKQAAAIGRTMIRQVSADDYTVLEIDAAVFINQDIAIQRELLRQVMNRLAGGLKDIRAVHIEMFRELFEGQVGRQVDLPYQLCAKRTCLAMHLIFGYLSTKALKTFSCCSRSG